jgi:hypothetical protein
MFTPASLIAAVTSASTPGRSGTGTCRTATPALTCGLAASDRRASLACPNARSTSSASPEPISVRSRLQALHVQVDRADDRLLVREQDVAPQVRARGREPRQVPEPARSEQQDLGLPRLLGGRQAHQGRSRPPAAGGLTIATSRSWRSASIGTGRAPHLLDPCGEPRHGRLGDVGGRRQHPHHAVQHRGGCVGRTRALRPAHRVAADVARQVGRIRLRRDVGHHVGL